MDKEVAAKILDLARKISGELDHSVHWVIDNGFEGDVLDYQKSVGQVLGEIYFRIMEPIMEKYPDLTPESLRGS